MPGGHLPLMPTSSGDPPTVCVFSPSPLLTVTIEANADDPDRPEIHIHAGGQGVWIARMATTLGVRVRLAGAFGSEAGEVLSG